MLAPSKDVSGVTVPSFLYGTAWKEEETQRLTQLAVENGFRGFDTANQRRHYFEAGVGEALARSLDSSEVTRDELFLQTKYTFRRGQDDRLPYDAKAPVSAQVEQSFARSLQHLQTERIDSFLLHGPSTSLGLTDDDWAAWRAIEELHAGGRVRLIGVSNFNLEQLQRLCQHARTQPAFVQNRCYAVRGWDRPVREFCRAEGIVYQGFSLLTANRQLLASPQMAEIAARYGRTVSQIVFRFALDVGMIPLTGTGNVGHMREDLAIFDFQLEPEDIAQIQARQ